MILYTLQSQEVVDILYEKGVYKAYIKNYPDYMDPNSDDHFSLLYVGMVELMNKHLGTNESEAFPVWAWHTFLGERESFDFVRAYPNPSLDLVLMKIDIPDSQVLLTRHDTWEVFCMSLNASMESGYIPSKEEQISYYNKIKETSTEEEEEKCIDDHCDFLYLKRSWAEIICSWDRLLELDFYDPGFGVEKEPHIQATFFELRKENVLSCKTVEEILEYRENGNSVLTDKFGLPLECKTCTHVSDYITEFECRLGVIFPTKKGVCKKKSEIKFYPDS